MRRKKMMVVGMGGLVAARNKNRLITSPVSGTSIFCTIPTFTGDGKPIAASPVYLKEGEHRAIHNGFGVWHAWVGHFGHCTNYAQAELEVAAYVAAALVSGAEIYWQGNNKCAVLQCGEKLVILELSTDGSNNSYFSVVTAYDKQQAQGTLVGTLP